MSLIGFVCPACRTGRPSHASTCPTCGWTQSRAKEREPSLPSGPTPTILLTAPNHRRLGELAAKSVDMSDEVSRFLSSELERASICEVDDVPPDVVTMNSRLLFQVDWLAGMHSRILSYPENYVPNGQFITIASPVGVALVGLREGDRMQFKDREGNPCSVQLVSVMIQPEASRRRRNHGEDHFEHSMREKKRSRRRSARILPMTGRRRATSPGTDEPGPDTAA
jgi:regulator of nucleoside diphosphate kinase